MILKERLLKMEQLGKATKVEDGDSADEVNY
jgi:hypothetical protein